MIIAILMIVAFGSALASGLMDDGRYSDGENKTMSTVLKVVSAVCGFAGAALTIRLLAATPSSSSANPFYVYTIVLIFFTGAPLGIGVGIGETIYRKRHESIEEKKAQEEARTAGRELPESSAKKYGKFLMKLPGLYLAVCIYFAIGGIGVGLSVAGSNANPAGIVVCLIVALIIEFFAIRGIIKFARFKKDPAAQAEREAMKGQAGMQYVPPQSASFARPNAAGNTTSQAPSPEKQCKTEIYELVDKLSHYNSLVIDDPRTEEKEWTKELLSYGDEAVDVIEAYLISCASGAPSEYWWSNCAYLVHLLRQFPGADHNRIYDRLVAQASQTNIWEYHTQIKDPAAQEMEKDKGALE